MDIEVAAWILEFLLRESVEDRILNALVRVLPLAIDSSSLKKAMLLRRIESEIAKGSVSEKILELLEGVEELDFKQGISASVAMKRAYCQVAVDCTVRFLDERVDSETKYFLAVKRIWRGRVSGMEKLEKGGFVSDELCGWKDEIEAALWDPSVCENVRVKCRLNNALEAVILYVGEAWETMGPSFLELVASTVSDDTMREVLGSRESRPCNRAREEATNPPELRQDLIVGNVNQVSQMSAMLPRRKHMAKKRYRGAVAGTTRGVKIADSEQVDRRASSNSFRCLPTPETVKLQEALKTSSLELQAVVRDPLPEALLLAENVISSMNTDSRDQDPSVRQSREDRDAPSSLIGKSAEVLANEANHKRPCSRLQNNVPKPNLLARNSTAHTYEWDDSIDTVSEGDMDHRNRINLPSPTKRDVSPLRKYEMKKLGRRRRKWSTLEEETLRTGVETYGKGRWKIILNSFPDIFEDRTEVDLKDKWRNMTRY